MTTAGSLRGLFRRLVGRSTPPPSASDPTFDIHDLRLLNPLLERHGSHPLSADPEQAATNVSGAARFILGTLATSPELRTRFPRALSDRGAGGFADWLTGPGSIEFRLGRDAEANIRAAFAEYPGDQAWRIYEFRPDMRTVFPFGLTPQQRGELLCWLLTHGKAEMDISAEAAVWSVCQRDELPDRGLVRSFQLNPVWQARVPHGLTRFGWDELLRVLRAEHGLSGSWVGRLPTPRIYSPWDELTLLRHARPDLDATFPVGRAVAGDADAILAWLDRQPGIPGSDPSWREELKATLDSGYLTRRGINVLAHFRFPCGLQEEAAQIARGLGAAGWAVARRGLLGNFPHFASDPAEYDSPELYPVSFIKLGAGEPLDVAYHRAGLHPRSGVHRIVGWSWELEDFPREAAERAGLANEVWTPSEFCAIAVRKIITDRPVLAMPPGITVPSAEPVSRTAFGLREGVYLFLFVFDMASGFERKNPLGLIRAFRRAFGGDGRAQLAVKVSRGEVNPEACKALTAAANEAGVIVIDRFLSRGELAGLVAACDCYVSLHRSEGFGLTVVEAMLLGRPVIATDYSATAEYLTVETGLPVRYHMTPVGPGHDPYPADSLWAKPDEAHAAERMRWVFENQDAGRAIGEAARRHVGEWLSPGRATRRMIERLEIISAAIIAATSPASSPSQSP